jgi:hypothetical protein
MSKAKWVRVGYGCDQNPGVWDIGGAIKTVCENASYPGVERVTISSYCGRNDDCRFYRIVGGDPKQQFSRLQDAVGALRKMRSAR